MLLAGGELEVLVYPSDVSITGTKLATARARAEIASALVDSPAYLTTSAESQRIEDDLIEIAGDRHVSGRADAEGRLARLRALDGRIVRLTVPFDEWETLYRQRLQVERDLRAAAAAGLEIVGPSPERRPPLVDRVVALGTAALIAVDAMLLATSLMRSRRR
jgi:hypothetical protein